MSEPPRGDQTPEPPGSAPWERPRRWNQQRLDATRVDELLAKLGNEEQPGRRRRRHSDQRGDTGEQATPASELIAALNAGQQQTPDDQHHDDEQREGDQPHQDRTGQAHTGQAENAAAADQNAEGEQAPAEQAPAPQPPAPGPGRVAMPGYDDSQTDQLPKLGPFEDVASIRESLRRQHAGEVPLGVPAVDEGTDDADRTSGAGAPGTTAAAVPGAAASAAVATASSTHARRRWRRNQGFLWAGRAVIAIVSAVILVFAGMRWNLIQQTNQEIADNSGHYVQPTDSNISTPSHKDPTKAGGGGAAGGADQKPAKLYEPENILLIGSDTRAGDNGDETNSDGREITAQSDTLMIAHVSGDRQNVSILSIPRDLEVPAPTCKEMDYSTGDVSDQIHEVSPTETWKITNAYAVGGPACTVLAVQKLTGLRIDRVIGIDFNGFKTMVDALDGIRVNVCKRIDDAELGLIVAHGGEQTIRGDQALSLVRARKVADDGYGNDFGRIHRQQVVLSAMLRQVTSAGVLLDTDKLEDFLHAFTQATFTDNVTFDSLLQLARQLGDLSPGKVTFYTLPVHPNPEDGGESQLLDPDAEAVFTALVNDERLPGEHTSSPETAPKTPKSQQSQQERSGSSSSSESSESSSSRRSSSSPATTDSPTTQPPQTLSVDPSTIDVQVVNVTGRAWVATETMNTLNSYGFAIGDEDLLRPETGTRDDITVEYSPGNRDAAVMVAAAVPGATLVRTGGLGEQVRLMLGTSFDGDLAAVSVGDPVPSSLRTTPRSPSADTSESSPQEQTRVTGAGAANDQSTPDNASGPSGAHDELAGAGTADEQSAGSTRASSTVTLNSSDLASVNASDATCA